jgi:hypothetical protein
VRRTWLCVLLVLGVAGCGAGGRQHHARAPHHAPLPAAPISARALTRGGRIVIVNGWQGVVTGQRLRIAVGRYARSGEGVALVSDAADFEREVRAPRGEGALRFVRRDGARLELRSRSGHRFSLDLRSLRLLRSDVPERCPRGALAGPLPRLRMRFTQAGLQPLPAPRSDAFAALLAIVAGVQGRVTAVEAGPASGAPCGLAARSLEAHLSVGTSRPVVSVARRTVFVARFPRGWRVWRVLLR